MWLQAEHFLQTVIIILPACDEWMGWSMWTGLLNQPSSAAAERVFPLLENSFSHQQRCSLDDCFFVGKMCSTIIVKFCKDYLKMLDLYWE